MWNFDSVIPDCNSRLCCCRREELLPVIKRKLLCILLDFASMELQLQVKIIVHARTRFGWLWNFICSLYVSYMSGLLICRASSGFWKALHILHTVMWISVGVSCISVIVDPFLFITVFEDIYTNPCSSTYTSICLGLFALFNTQLEGWRWS